MTGSSTSKFKQFFTLSDLLLFLYGIYTFLRCRANALTGNSQNGNAKPFTIEE